jgi:hypothetical protein
MVQIADRIWSAWREQADQWDEPVLLLLFSPTGDHRAAADALRECVLEVQGSFSEEGERSGLPDPPFPGEWDWVRVPAGVLVQVTECDVLEDMLPAVAAALERRGIEGGFDVTDPPAVATRPGRAHLLECRVRIRGERIRRGPRDYLWQADLEAHEAVLGFAERWCRRHGERAAHSLSSGTVGPVPVEAGEEVLSRLLDDVVANMHVELASVTADEFRAVAARAWTGGVSLVVGGGLIEGGQWHRPLDQLTQVLRDHADLFAYGYIKRGWWVTDALLSHSLPGDWPRGPERHHQPRGIGFSSEAFEDLYAPDAFAVQLLGPGYADRVPARDCWRRDEVGSASQLLEHADLPAWFDAPFVPFGRPANPSEPSPPAVLTRARVDLAPIVYAPGVLGGVGYTDVEPRGV